MMRDIYISICYLASQSRKKSNPLFSFKQNYYKETSNYQISFETLMTNNEQAIKDDPIIKEAKSVDINIFEFAPRIFAALRRNDELTQDQIIESFLPNNNKQGIQESQGRSGNFFINTDDKKFILKTINYEELELIRGMLLEKMTNHFNSNSSSIISRIYGIYKIIMPTGFFKQEEIILILMKNVCDIFGEQILSKYDIKGSKFDRSVTITNMNFSTKVMKDNNFDQLEGVFFLNEENSKRLLDTIKSDANFFRSLGVMDYSLLVVKIKINEDEMKYLFGMRHRETTEKEYIELFKSTVPVRQQSLEEIKEMEEIYNRQINKLNIRFDRKEIIALKKYMYPSLNPDTMYIFSIIDFFQLYDIKKNLETQMKRLLAKKENISSVPPEDYARRFINNIEQKTNCKQFFDN